MCLHRCHTVMLVNVVVTVVFVGISVVADVVFQEKDTE